MQKVLVKMTRPFILPSSDGWEGVHHSEESSLLRVLALESAFGDLET